MHCTQGDYEASTPAQMSGHRLVIEPASGVFSREIETNPLSDIKYLKLGLFRHAKTPCDKY